jgi:hypothetical protein
VSSEDGSLMASSNIRNAVHLDFIAHWYRPEYVRSVITRLAEAGANTLLVECHDKLPALSDLGMTMDRRAASLLATVKDAARTYELSIIPLVQTLGHVEHLLGHPKWVHWRESRDSPYQFCPTHPGLTPVLCRLMDTTIRDFSDSKFLSIGGDEPWFGGITPCMRCNAQIKRRGVSAIYADHYAPLIEHAHGLGVTPMIWGDYVMAHPEILKRLQRNVVIKHWQYAHTRKAQWVADLALINRRGFKVWAAPSARCSGDSHFLPDVRRHAANVRSAIAAAFTIGAGGLINTAWALRLTPVETAMPLLYAGAMCAARRCRNLAAGFQTYADIYWRGRVSGFARFYSQLCPVWPGFVHAGYYERMRSGAWRIAVSCESRLKQFIVKCKGVSRALQAADHNEAHTRQSLMQMRDMRPATELGQFERNMWINCLDMQLLRIETTRLWLGLESAHSPSARRVRTHMRHTERLKRQSRELLTRVMDESSTRWEIQRRFEEEDRLMENYL